MRTLEQRLRFSTETAAAAKMMTTKPAPPKPVIAAPTVAFYTQLFLIIVSLGLGICGLLAEPRPLLQWLPSLLLLVCAAFSLSALIYLNKGISYRSRTYLLLYTLLTISMAIIRIFVACLFILGLTRTKVEPKWAVPLVIVALVHTAVDFLFAWVICLYRQAFPTKRTPMPTQQSTSKPEGLVLVEGRPSSGKTSVEELTVFSLNKEMTQSKSTLFTYASELAD